MRSTDERAGKRRENAEGEGMIKQPQQPIARDSDGVVRFHANQIVRFLLDAGPYDMNKLALMPFTKDDRSQFAQLIGYSVSGFGDLSYADKKAVAAADAIAERMTRKRK